MKAAGKKKKYDDLKNTENMEACNNILFFNPNCFVC